MGFKIWVLKYKYGFGTKCTYVFEKVNVGFKKQMWFLNSKCGFVTVNVVFK